VITDNSSYPTGVANDIIGIVKVTQPDGIVREGDWNSPDIYFTSGSLVIAQVELRKRSDQKPQQGTYVVEYTVDHPSYTPTTLTRTFVLSYTPVGLTIEEQFDVFTPILKVQDSTDYEVGGFNTPTLTRLWNAQIGTVSSVAGTSSILDLIYSANYYDAAYDISLTTDATYQHSTYSYLSVVDRITDSIQVTANTPPDFDTLKAYLKTIKDNFDNLETCNTKDAKDDYEYASALLAQIKSRLCDSDLVGLDKQITDFLNVYHGHVSVAYVNTNTPIPAYDYTNVDCGTGSSPSSTTDDRITNQMILNWNTAYNSIPPDDIEIIVGVSSNSPTEGTNTLQLNQLVNWRIRLTVNKVPMSQVSWQGNPYFSKPLVSDTITLTGMTWTNSDLIQIHFY
jgi:hypothetical protein